MDTINIGNNCKVSYLADFGCVKIQWIGSPNSKEFREGCDTALRIMYEKGSSKLLVDNTEARLFSVSDQKWLNDVWLPRAEMAGYTYSATVLGNSDAFVKFAAHNIASKRDQSKFVSKFFITIDEACSWLKMLK